MKYKEWQTHSQVLPKQFLKEVVKEEPAQVSYILQKFFNWFEGRGFNNEEKSSSSEQFLRSKKS